MAIQRYQQLADAGRLVVVRYITAAATAEAAVAQANINSAAADVRSTRANLAQLQTQLGQTLVRAPAMGLLLKHRRSW